MALSHYSSYFCDTTRVLFCGLLLVVSGLSARTIRVVGSDFVAATLQWNRATTERVGESEVQVRMTGSLLGVLKLKEGLADVAFVLQRSEGSQSFDGFHSIPLGFWGIYFAVKDENPLTEVTEGDLTEILRKTRDGLKSEWGSLLPAKPKWTHRLIFVTFNVLDSDPSFPVLVNQFFDNEVPEKYDLIGERIEDPYRAGPANFLILSRLPDPARGLRSLAWIAGDEAVGYPPSPESLFYGDYPLRIPLHLVVADNEDPKVKAFVQDFFASGSLEILEKSGLVPVPENVQKQALLEFDLEI